MINKDTLKHLMTIESNNTDIYTALNAGTTLVASCAKNHGLKDSLMEPEDGNAVLQVLREVNQFYKIFDSIILLVSCDQKV